jgi:hypothetical protein
MRLLSRALLVAAAVATLMADLAGGSAHGQPGIRSPAADAVGGRSAVAVERRSRAPQPSHDQRFWSGLNRRCLMRADSLAALERCHLALSPSAAQATLPLP